jgi:hypothetical protein
MLSSPLMSLTHPAFLFALFALLIPIIIHLFNFRRFKRLVFPNVRFLKEVELQTRSRNKLKHLLVLLSRLAAITALVLAFCRPFIPLTDQDMLQGDKHIAIYLDNSFSMELENEKGSLFRQAKEQVRSLVNSIGRTDRFLLVTNDFAPEHQRLISATELLEYLDDVKPSPVQRSLGEVAARVQDIFRKQGAQNQRLFVFSDMQKQMFDLEPAKIDSSLDVSLLYMQSQGQGNVYIDTVSFYSPLRSAQTPEELRIKVVNSSAKDIKGLPLKLSINGVQKAIGSMDIAAFSSSDSILKFSNENSGWMKGRVTIEDHPIVFDDELFFSYQVAAESRILSIGAADVNARCLKVFSSDPYFKTTSSDPRSLDLASLAAQDFVILAQVKEPSTGLSNALEQFVAEGGTLLIIPAVDISLDAYRNLLSRIGANAFQAMSVVPRKASTIDLLNPFYKDVFEQAPANMNLPSTVAHYPSLSRVESSEEKLLTLQDGSSLLSAFPFQNGRSYVLSASLDSEMSDLASHSIFITSLLRMAESSARNSRLYQTIGRDEALSVSYRLKNDEPLKMSSEDGLIEFIPEQQSIGNVNQIHVRGQVQEVGFYSVKAGEEVLQVLAYDQDRRESVMAFYSTEEIETLCEANPNIRLNELSAIGGGGLQMADLGAKQLWKIFLIAALIFLAFEVLLLKFWKP